MASTFTSVLKNPQVATALTTATFGAASLGARGVIEADKFLGDMLQKYVWLPTYAKFLKKEYGEEFMRAVDELSQDDTFVRETQRVADNMEKKRLHDKGIKWHPHYGDTSDHTPDPMKEWMSRSIPRIERDYPDVARALLDDPQTKEKFTTFVSKEMGGRYNPTLRKPERADKTTRGSREQRRIQYKNAINKLRIKNPKTGRDIKTSSVLSAPDAYGPELVQQAQKMVQAIGKDYKFEVKL
jgi:hypothetical protein